MESKLINFSIADYSSKSDLEHNLFKWNEVKDEYLSKLEAKGMIRFTILRIWNKDGIFRLGYLFEYEDELSFKKCQPIWQEIEKNQTSQAPVKIFSNRGIVIDDKKFKSGI